ncbi:hypothetical protein SETIT_9G244000v2 [Setaria italica]|uniref:Retrotransposon gag domain-containing protein n=1 Tax=Setaria italica TaxID=4555 RepID=A0A368SK44_SETIT|nr:hypothetical protein SETIT_9G244000v2 [Setaria italica]
MKGVEHYLEETCVEPADKSSMEWRVWDMTNATVMLWLMNSMSPSVCRMVELTSTAAEMWKRLRDTYIGVCSVMMVETQWKAEQLKQEGRTVQERVIHFLNGLNREFEPRRVAMLCQSTLPTMEEAISAMVQEENPLRVMRDNNPGRIVVAGVELVEVLMVVAMEDTVAVVVVEIIEAIVEMELEILEPTMMADNLQPEKRTLVYPVTVSVIAAPDVLPRPGDPPSPPPADGDGRRRGNRTSVHARLGPHPAEIAHVASQDGAAASSGVLRRGGSAPLDIKDPTASALPEGASPPVNPRTMAASGPEREALASASHLADRAQRAAACASPEVVSPPVNPQTTAASGPEREASALASPLVDRAQRAAACASPEGVSPLVSVSRITGQNSGK